MTLHYNLEMQAYLDHPGIGSSLLKQILSTPADFKAAKANGSEETKATLIGTAIHTAILEPKEFYRRYALQPDDWGNKTILEKNGGGKGRWDQFKKDNADKIVFGFDEAETIRAITNAVGNHDILQTLLNAGRSEVTAFTECLGIELKARSDLVIFNDAIYDVKTTTDNIDNIFSLVFKNGWHFQAAQQLRVTNANLAPSEYIRNYGWIIITTNTPAIHIRIVKAPPDLIKWGMRDHDIALKKLQECIASDIWPGYNTAIETLEIPDWARQIYEK